MFEVAANSTAGGRHVVVDRSRHLAGVPAARGVGGDEQVGKVYQGKREVGTAFHRGVVVGRWRVARGTN